MFSNERPSYENKVMVSVLNSNKYEVNSRELELLFLTMLDGGWVRIDWIESLCNWTSSRENCSNLIFKMDLFDFDEPFFILIKVVSVGRWANHLPSRANSYRFGGMLVWFSGCDGSKQKPQFDGMGFKKMIFRKKNPLELDKPNRTNPTRVIWSVYSSCGLGCRVRFEPDPIRPMPAPRLTDKYSIFVNSHVDDENMTGFKFLRTSPS